MTIGIVGQGFVGNAIYQKFKNFYDIATYDLDETKSNSSEEVTMSKEIVFVCLPTPMKVDGDCYTGIVEEAVQKIYNYGKCKVAVIKSTGPPGTAE